MAPVAGTITHTDEYRFVFTLRLLPEFFVPFYPVYGVVGMLKQIGTAGMDKGIGVFGIGFHVNLMLI